MILIIERESRKVCSVRKNGETAAEETSGYF